MQSESLATELATILNQLDIERKNISSFYFKTKDYSPMIAVHLENLSRRQNHVHVEVDNGCRFVDAFAAGDQEELRNGCDVLKRYVADVDKAADETKPYDT